VGSKRETGKHTRDTVIGSGKDFAKRSRVDLLESGELALGYIGRAYHTH